MRFIHIRPMPVRAPDRRGVNVDVYPDSSGATICLQYGQSEEAVGQWAALGWGLSSPSEACWNRKTGCRIAASRLRSSPLQLQFRDLKPELTSRHVLQTIRTLLLENPPWRLTGEKSVRPSRFNARALAKLQGPDGCLVNAWIDVKLPGGEATVGCGIAPLAPPRSHWAMKAPAWTSSLLQGRL